MIIKQKYLKNSKWELLAKFHDEHERLEDCTVSDRDEWSSYHV